ncbi:MAG: DNA polymerase IV [Clostridiales Family XIII bacterium]|jgi:DNA polymerase-4|nr:DNA polymerase IV [Clostridiales Family XIII bacterium]
MRSIFHIDANSAYLSWTAAEMLRCGHSLDIRTVASVIGGDPEKRHGIVLAKSITAKKAGVQTGESLVEAKRKCPGLRVFAPDYNLYLQQSNAMYGILAEYSDIIERFSIDECYLDYTASVKAFGDPVETAHAIKERIKNELGFTVNVGVSVNKLLAKMGSEMRKPDLVHTLFPEEIAEKMWPLPVRELFFCGRATEKKLAAVGLSTIGQVAAAPRSLMEALLKPSMGKLIHEYANGIDDTPVNPNDGLVQKGVGNSTTTSHDVTTQQEAAKVILALSEHVASRIRKMGVGAQVVSVTVRNNELNFYRHQMKTDHAIDSTTEIYETAMRVFREMWRGDPLRLLGVHLGSLSADSARQFSLFDKQDEEKLRKIDAVVDAIRSKHGESAVQRGVLAGSDVPPLRVGINDGNYLMMRD